MVRPILAAALLAALAILGCQTVPAEDEFSRAEKLTGASPAHFEESFGVLKEWGSITLIDQGKAQVNYPVAFGRAPNLTVDKGARVVAETTTYFQVQAPPGSTGKLKVSWKATGPK